MTLHALKRIAVTGGAGQIAYSLLFRIASGEMLGESQPIALHILEVPDALKALEGVKMELEDCSFPLLKEIHIGSDPYTIFDNVDYALLVGATPRGPGMERKDLLSANGKIFVQQGKALDKVANEDVKVLVVGNPCNTNCLIAMNQAKRISKKNFYAMTRLDQNRAEAALALKSEAAVSDVSNVIIWGNHSSTQVPDFTHATIGKKNVLEVIKDRKWLEEDFFFKVQKRGAEIIAARGKSSAASAASAIIDTMKSLHRKTPEGKWFSLAVLSDGNTYGVKPGLVFSFPCRSSGNGSYEVVEGIKLDSFIQEKMQLTEKELLEEKELINLSWDVLQG